MGWGIDGLVLVIVLVIIIVLALELVLDLSWLSRTIPQSPLVHRHTRNARRGRGGLHDLFLHLLRERVLFQKRGGTR